MERTKYARTVAVRNYDVVVVKFEKCDVCKALYREAYEFIPEIKFHTWDSVIVCKHCVADSKFFMLEGDDEDDQHNITGSDKLVEQH
jgi:hypothetical protein